MASIQQRNNSFRVMWRDQGRQRSLSFGTKKAAKAYKAQVEHGLVTGLQVDPHAGREPLSVYVERFLDGLTVKPKTAYNYRNVWSLIQDVQVGGCAIGDRLVNTLTKADCQRAVASLKHSQSKTARTVLKQALQVACDERVLHENPATGLSVPAKQPAPVEPLSAPELREVAKAAGHYETFVLWQGLMGTRFGEAAGLQPSQFKDGKVTIDRALVDVAGKRHIGSTKTGQIRTLPVPDVLLQRLHEAEGASLSGEWVFTTVRGKQLRNNNFRTNYWLPALEAAGVRRRRIHDLRHTCASLLIANGASIKAVQRWLGHSTIEQTLDVYSHLYHQELNDLSDRLQELATVAPPRALRAV